MIPPWATTRNPLDLARARPFFFRLRAISGAQSRLRPSACPWFHRFQGPPLWSLFPHTNSKTRKWDFRSFGSMISNGISYFSGFSRNLALRNKISFLTNNTFGSNLSNHFSYILHIFGSNAVSILIYKPIKKANLKFFANKTSVFTLFFLVIVLMGQIAP